MSVTTPTPRADTTRRILTKVPEITVVFWVLKLLSTGMGEAMSDYAGSVSTTLLKSRCRRSSVFDDFY